MPSPLPPPTPRTLPSLPSRKVSAILAAGMLAAGVALGALIGPAPASSLASGTRAAAMARVLALLALDEGTGAGSQLLLSGGATTHANARQATSHVTSAASKPPSSAAASGNGRASGGQSETSSTSSGSAPPSGSASPTKSKSSPGSGEPKPVPLAPIAHVWLIVLPYAESFANLSGQPANAPYTTGELLHRGTLLSGYSSLAASELAGDATLLSGQVAASLSTVVAPCPAGAPSASGTANGTGTPSATAPAAASPAASTTPCATAEPAGAQAADGFLREVVPRIEASAGYREGGLIAITFAAAGEGASASAPAAPTAGSPGAGTPAAGSPAIAYPPGTQVSSATATGTPGALLLSPYLAHPGARLTAAFDQLAPRGSLEELLRDPSKTAHQ